MGTRQRKLGVAMLLAAFMSVGSAGRPTSGSLQSYDVELLIFRNLGGRETPESWGVEAAEDSAQQLAIPEDDPEPATPPRPSRRPSPAIPPCPSQR